MKQPRTYGTGTGARSRAAPARYGAAVIALALACAALLSLPRIAHAASYTLVETDDWTAVPASTINLDTPLLGDPDSVSVTGDDLLWCDADTKIDGQDIESLVTDNGNNASVSSGLFVAKSTTTDSTVTYDGTATLTWKNVGVDADGDRVDVSIKVSNVKLKSESEYVSNEEYASVISVKSDDGTNDIPIGTIIAGTYARSVRRPVNIDEASATYTVSFTKTGTSEAASGRYLFFVSDIDIYNSNDVCESITLKSGFNSTVYTYDPSYVVVSNGNSTFSADLTRTNGWADGDDESAMCATSTSGTFTFSWGGTGSTGSYLFSEMPHTTITSSAGSGGTIDPEGETTAWWKNDFTYTITPSTGYKISDVMVDGKSVGAVGSYTFETVTSEHTIKATFERITYTVEFDANGGSGSMSSKTYTYGTSYTLPANTFTRTGYTFTGWNTEDDGSGASYSNKASVKNLTSTDGGTVTLYAQWEANTYTVVFDANGGSGSMSSKTYTYGTSYTLPANTFTRTGYTFTGWNTKSSGSGTSYSDEATVKNLTSTDGGTVTLYAQWKANTYTVTYEPNADGDDVTGMPDDTDLTYDTEGTVPDDEPERRGYDFTGWNTEEDGSGTSYEPGDTIVDLTSEDGGTVPFYAQWEAIISVRVPTTVACCIMADGTVVAPSGYAIENLSVVDVETSSIEGTDVYEGTETYLYQGNELVFSTSEKASTPITIAAEAESVGLEWQVADMDADEDAELLAAALEDPVAICDVTFTFQESEG